MSEPVLCYVEGPWAFFTTQPLEKQWGDDWDDAPYEWNSGEPYYWHKRSQAVYLVDGKETTVRAPGAEFLRREEIPDDEQDPYYEIIRVAWDGPFEQPCDGHSNSPYSVERINAGAIAWLSTHSYMDKQVAIPAGTTLDEFRRLIAKGGGTVYLDVGYLPPPKETDQ